MSEARRANKTERAVAEFEEYKNMGYGQAYRPSSEAIETALSALRAQENEPLTLEQLLEMEGKPVFIGMSGTVTENKWHIITHIKNDPCRDNGEVFTVSDDWNFTDEDVENGWVKIYAREPAPDGGKE